MPYLPFKNLPSFPCKRDVAVLVCLTSVHDKTAFCSIISGCNILFSAFTVTLKRAQQLFLLCCWRRLSISFKCPCSCRGLALGSSTSISLSGNLGHLISEVSGPNVMGGIQSGRFFGFFSIKIHSADDLNIGCAVSLQLPFTSPFLFSSKYPGHL